jgi:DNA-binding NarL/FixJ family response regulator
MGGGETIKKLLKIDPKVKSIVSSGYSNKSAIAEHKKHGFRSVLVKPYTMEQLGKALYDLI